MHHGLGIAPEFRKMDTLGFEPRAFRMRSGCDTTTPCALDHSGAYLFGLQDISTYVVEQWDKHYPLIVAIESWPLWVLDGPGVLSPTRCSTTHGSSPKVCSTAPTDRRPKDAHGSSPTCSLACSYFFKKSNMHAILHQAPIPPNPSRAHTSKEVWNFD